MKILAVSDVRVWEMNLQDPFRFRYSTILNAISQAGHTLSFIHLDGHSESEIGSIQYLDDAQIPSVSVKRNREPRSQILQRRILEIVYPRRRLAHEVALNSLIKAENPDLIIFLMGIWPRPLRNIKGDHNTILFAEENFALSGNGAVNPSLYGKIKIRLSKNFIRRLLPRPVTVVIISETERKWAEYFYPKSRIEMVPLFIDEPFWLEKTDFLRNSIEIFAIGNYFDARNAFGLKAVLDELEAQQPSLPPKVTLVSRAGIHTILKGVSDDRLEYIGEVEDPRSYYDNSKICLVPAFNVSGAKNQIAQGWARGCAVAASGSAARTVHGENGFDLVTGSNPTLLAGAALKLLNSDEMRARVVKNGRESFDKHHSTERILKNFIASIERVSR